MHKQYVSKAQLKISITTIFNTKLQLLQIP